MRTASTASKVQRAPGKIDRAATSKEERVRVIEFLGWDNFVVGIVKNRWNFVGLVGAFLLGFFWEEEVGPSQGKQIK